MSTPSTLIASILLLSAEATAAAQSVRIVDGAGAPISGLQVQFFSRGGPEALKDAHAWLEKRVSGVPPLEHGPARSAFLSVTTNANGLATPPRIHGLRWCAWVRRDDHGVETELEDDDNDGTTQVTELRLQLLRKVLVVDSEGKGARGAWIKTENSARIVMTDDEGMAHLAEKVETSDTRSGHGVRWVAPGADLLVAWADAATSATVMRLPPTGSLTVTDGEHAPGVHPAMLRAGDLEISLEGGCVAFDYVPAGVPVPLGLSADVDASWRRIVTLSAGEKSAITLRAPPVAVRLCGIIAEHHCGRGPLSICAWFADRDPGEAAAIADVDADGAFVLSLDTRRAAHRRDVMFAVMPRGMRVPSESPFRGIQRRLGTAGRTGFIDVGVLDPSTIEPWLRGVLTDMSGRPLPNEPVYLTRQIGRGCGTTGGYVWERVRVMRQDDSRPVLEIRPRVVVTDAQGRFQVTGWHGDGSYSVALPDDRTVAPEDLEAPNQNVHVIAEARACIDVRVDGTASQVANRFPQLTFEARRDPDGPGEVSVAVTESVVVDEPETDEETYNERLEETGDPPWAGVMHLVPGRWTVTMRVDDVPDIVAEGVIEIPAATGASRLRVVLGAVRPLPLLQTARITIVDDDGTPCDARVWCRGSEKDAWGFVGADEGVAIVAFPGAECEVVVHAPGFGLARSRVPPGEATVKLRRVSHGTLRIDVPPPPVGVQDSVMWYLRVELESRGDDELGTTPVTPPWCGDTRWHLMNGASRYDFEGLEPGLYRVELRGGDLTYAERRIVLGSCQTVMVRLPVELDSPGMRALTMGVER